MLNRMKVLMAGLALISMSGVAAAAGPGYGLARNTDCPRLKGTTVEQRVQLNRAQERRWRNLSAPGFRNGKEMGKFQASWRGHGNGRGQGSGPRC
jgi:hypothetical protein